MKFTPHKDNINLLHGIPISLTFLTKNCRKNIRQKERSNLENSLIKINFGIKLLEGKILNKKSGIESYYLLVSIIVINFNGKKYLGNVLDDCISSILNNEYFNFEVLFIDNGSSDGSVEHIKHSFGHDDRIRIISLGKNHGTAKAKNEGIKASKGDIILLLNNDVILKKETLTEMVKVMKINPDIGILGCKLISPSGETQSEGESFSCFTSLLNIMYFSLWKRKNETKTNKLGNLNMVEWVIGAAIMVRRNMITKLSLYDEDYFMYCEEEDLAYRAQKAGYKVACLTTCEVIHYEDATARHFSAWQRDLRARNDLLFIFKNYSQSKLARALLLCILKIFYLWVYNFVTFDKFGLREVSSNFKAFRYIKQYVKPPN